MSLRSCLAMKTTCDSSFSRISFACTASVIRPTLPMRRSETCALICLAKGSSVCQLQIKPLVEALTISRPHRDLLSEVVAARRNVEKVDPDLLQLLCKDCGLLNAPKR